MHYYIRPMSTFMQESVKEYLSQRYRNARRYSVPKSSETKPQKMVTASYASTVDPTFNNDASMVDLVAYERNVAVLLYESKSSNEEHILKLLKIRGEEKSSVAPALHLKEEYPFFGHIKWVSKM